MIRVSAAERRRLLVRRHHLNGDAPGVDAVATSLVGLHATEPASVHLAVLTRSSASALSNVDAALHQRRSLVRWMGMRRTLFVLPRDLVPVVQAAAGRSVAAQMRRLLIRRLELNGAQPAIPDGDVRGWLAAVEDGVADTLQTLGNATGWQLGQHDARLRTVIPPYVRRFDLEHTFRFCTQALGWTTPRVRSPEQADRWTRLVLLAYTQLRLARPIGLEARLPWERRQPPHRLTPARIRRGFPRLLPILGTRASSPKPCGRSPGRPIGSRRGPAPREPAIKKAAA
jgi:hypothetical protein